MCREFYTVAVGYVKIFNTEGKMEAVVLLPKKPSPAGSAASLGGELSALSEYRHSLSVPKCQCLRSQIWTYVCRISYDSAEFPDDSLGRHRGRNFGMVFFVQ